MADQQHVLAGIDAGGTTYKCALASLDGEIITSRRIPVTTPEATINLSCTYLFEELTARNLDLMRLGVASFGPIDVDPASSTYGSILTTPKPFWNEAPVRTMLQERMGVEVVVDTDVNGALGAEMKWGAAKDATTAAYMTIGTGIGAGIYANGAFLGRPSHPEFGHIRMQRHPADNFEGVCPLHSDCLEGLASAPAIAARFGDPTALPDDHIVWEMESFYLAQACLSLSLTIRPQVIILGGGVMLRDGLLERVRSSYAQLNNGYLDDTLRIERPDLGDNAGLKGGILLAMNGR